MNMILFYVRAMRWTLKKNICFVNLRKKKKYVYSLKGTTQTESVVCDERIV